MLLDARELTRDLGPQAELNLALPPGPELGARYHVRMQAGTIAFADTSRPLPQSFAQLTVFTKHVSEDVCGIEPQLTVALCAGCTNLSATVHRLQPPDIHSLARRPGR